MGRNIYQFRRTFRLYTFSRYLSDPRILEHPKKFERALEKARRELIKLEGVLGVGYGFKETKGRSTGEHAILVFVKKKKRIDTIHARQKIPSEYEGVKTDVVELGKRKQESHDDSDMMFVDWTKVHEENLENIKKITSSKGSRDPDFGNLAVVVDDGTLVPSPGVIEQKNLGIWESTNWSGVCDKEAELAKPTLVITGTDDNDYMPHGNALILAGKIPGAWLAQIKDAGHAVMNQYPAEIGKIMNTFLSTTSPNN